MKKFTIFALIVLAVVGGIVVLADSRKNAKQEANENQQANDNGLPTK